MKSTTLLLTALSLFVSPLAGQAPPPDVAGGIASRDARPLDAFFHAPTPADRERVAAELLDSELPFGVILEELRQGPTYSSEVPRGRLEPTLLGEDGHPHRYLLMIPETYDATRAYPVQVYLHGATYYPDRGPGGSWWPELELVTSEDHISVLPLAWEECLWWENGQVEALRHILNSVRGVFNVDDDRVFLLGVSDGGAGVYFSATHNPTPWAAFVPMIGNPQVLENPNYRVDGHTFAANLRNRPLFIVNTADDPVHPPSVIAPYLKRYREAGVRFEYHEYSGGHDLAWWPLAVGELENFLVGHRRDPHPDVVEWVTDRVDRYNRMHWLMVDELGSASSGREARRLASFASDGSPGAVIARRTDNTFEVETHGVRGIRLLLSPDEVDFDAPVHVSVNGKPVFDAVVPRDPGALLRWATIDFDRAMLYGAELEIDVPR